MTATAAARRPAAPVRPQAVFKLVDEVFGDDLHAKRVLSLSNAAMGAIASGSLAIHMIGQGLAQAMELNPKHCIKQVDRLLSNEHINVWEMFSDWVPFVLGDRKEAVVALDWTDFDRDGHSTAVLSLVTGHGRGTPLIWTTVKKGTLKDHRNFHEDAVLHRLREIVPKDVRVTVLADRGFGDTELYRFVEEELGFDYIIRFRDNILVTSKQGEEREAFLWVPESGRARTLDQVLVTGKRKKVPRVVAVRKKAMKDAWCLATSRLDLKVDEIISLYGKRWGIETVFRDIKDYRFGMGMKKVRTESTDRRDRLFLISALAIALLTLLGAAGEAVGLERTIKANTVKTRSYSFWRQGCIYYALLPGMKAERATLLINKFHELMAQHRIFKKVFGIL
jgi:hypothetical protein